MDTDAQRREVLSELDNEWHTLKHGNPVPGLYPQDGTEQVKVRGDSRIDGDKTVTQYEIIVSDRGQVVGRYRVLAEERVADYRSGYTEEDAGDEADPHDEGRA
ncbi:MAG: hypothetical protein PF508_18385 [Spirochaeta sp.]|jgi:hypothetical protein|nr:hypothetical protein [Spirochaeta sp.]